MTNADGTTGCHPPGRGFDSRRVHQCGPVAQRLEQVSAARRATFHHPCRHDGKRTAASAAWKGERSSGAMDADMTERHGREPSQVRILPDLHLPGQVRRQEWEPFGGRPCRRVRSRRMPAELQHHQAGLPVGFDSPPCMRSLARAGHPEFHQSCRRDQEMPGECRQDYRIEHPASAGRSGVQIAPRLRKDVK